MQRLGFTWPMRLKSLPRKTSKLMCRNPYRKPTLVDRASSPRGTSESSLRNSANKRPYLRYKACLVETERRNLEGKVVGVARFGPVGSETFESSNSKCFVGTRIWRRRRGDPATPSQFLV